MKTKTTTQAFPSARPATKGLRLGFLGVGRIGLSRLQSALATGSVTSVAAADPQESMRAQVRAIAPEAHLHGTLEDLLRDDVDAVVIATPSARHAEEALRCLKSGKPVFCQKPLGRNADEVRAVIDMARRKNRLLGVDFSYRGLQGAGRIAEMIRHGDLGRIHAADLVFHNAYGPDKDWFYDYTRSGGGCVIDLGVHLLDLGLGALGWPEVRGVTARLYAKGEPLRPPRDRVEDYAEARFDLEGGACLRLSCSWHLPAGCDAVIGATFYGTRGGASLRNVNGSFFEFVTEHLDGRSRRTLVTEGEGWADCEIQRWIHRLAKDPSYDPQVETVRDVATWLDAVYERGIQ